MTHLYDIFSGVTSRARTENRHPNDAIFFCQSLEFFPVELFLHTVPSIALFLASLQASAIHRHPEQGEGSHSDELDEDSSGISAGSVGRSLSPSTFFAILACS